MNERNFHIFYRMLAPGRAVEKHKDSKTAQDTEEVVTENMTTTEGECLLENGMMGLPKSMRDMCKLGDTSEKEEPVSPEWPNGGFQVQTKTFEDFVYLRGGTGLILKARLLLCAFVLPVKHQTKLVLLFYVSNLA